MNQAANGRISHPALGFFNLVPVGLLVIFKVFKLTYVALRGIMRSPNSLTVAQASQARQQSPAQPEQPVRREAAPSKLKEAVDEPAARVVRRSSSESSAARAATEESRPSIWDKKPAMRIADRHIDVKLSGKQYRFSVYLAENEICRIEMGQARKPLAAFTRSMAASERVPFTLEEAIEYTRRELASARRRGTSRKTETNTTRPAAQPEVSNAPQHTQPFPEQESGPPIDDDAPHWASMPCFDELDAQAPISNQPTEPARGPETVSASAPRPQQSLRRDPPPPAETPLPSGSDGVEEGPVDFRGARRVVGKIVTIGVIEVKKPKKAPFEIYAITLKGKDGDEQQFRGYELEQHVAKHRVAIGDTISLKRGRQLFWVIRDGVRTEKSRNIYDFQVVAQARR